MKIALISCVKTKANRKCMAKDLYISTLFKMNYAFAKKTCDKVFILSAKYGLLDECDIVEPYEKTLNTMGKTDRMAWSEKVLMTLKNIADLENDEFVFLAGMKYREYLLPHINNFDIPMEGLSFGRQLQLLKELLG